MTKSQKVPLKKGYLKMYMRKVSPKIWRQKYD